MLSSSEMSSRTDVSQSGIHSETSRPGFLFDKICESTQCLSGVRRSDLKPGDRIEVDTRNSRYVIRVIGDGSFLISGGWFQKLGLSASSVGINGCTWGGRAIKTDWIAAPGLFLEFENGVRTTRIQNVRWLQRNG